ALSGAHFVPGAAAGVVAERSWLGFPTTGRVCGLVRGGCVQHFQGGTLYTSTGGIWPVRRGIEQAWIALGAETGRAGYPVSGEISDGDGVYQQFEYGR